MPAGSATIPGNGRPGSAATAPGPTDRGTADRGITDRGTGDSAASGATASRAHTTPERGVAPRQVMYTFIVSVTPAMRAATTPAARHRLILQAIMGLPPIDFDHFIRHLPDADHWWGFSKPIPEGRSSVRYRLPQTDYLWGATGASLKPNAVVGADGQDLPTGEADLLVSAVTAYRTAVGSLHRPLAGSRAEFLRNRIGAVVAGLTQEADAGDPDVVEGLMSASRIADKVTRLDARALGVLVERDPFDSSRPDPVPYTRRAALRQLRLVEGMVDVLLISTSERARSSTEQAASLQQAIGRLESFDDAWAIRQRLRRFESKHSALVARGEATYRSPTRRYDLVGLLVPGVDDARRRWLGLLDDYRAALRRAGATPPSVEQDFEHRISDFYRTLGTAMPPIALQALSALLVRIDDTLTRGQDHRELLYDRLALLLPQPGPYTKDQIAAALIPVQDGLAHAYPILGYPFFASHVLKLFSGYRSPKYRHGTYPPRFRFSLNLHHDLVNWHDRVLRARKAIAGDPDTVWQADRLVAQVLHDAGLPAGHYLHQVAAAHPTDTHLLDILLTALSIALLFVPGPGWVALALRGTLIVGQAVALGQQFEEQSASQAFAGVGAASHAPSGWWLVLSAASLGLDVVDVAALIKVKPQRLVEAIERDSVNALLREERISRRTFAKAVLQQRRQELARRFFAKADEATAYLGAGPVINRATVEAAGFMVRIGYTRLEEFLVDIRVLTGRQLSDETLERAFREARAAAGPAPETIPLDQVRRAVRERPAIKAKVEQLDAQLERRRTTIEEVIERGGDEAQLRAAERSVAKLEKRHQGLRRQLARAEHLAANLQARIRQLQHQAREIAIAQNEARQLRSLGGRSTATTSTGLFTRDNVTWAGIDVLDRRAEDIAQRMGTLRRVERGEALLRHERERLHEELVTMWLSEQNFTRVRSQVKLEVTNTAGQRVVVVVDDLVEVSPRTFRVYDAKWAHDTHVSPGNGRKLLTTAEQRQAYLDIAQGRAVEIRIVDPDSATFFEVSTDNSITVDSLLYLVLGEPTKPFRLLPLQ